MLNVFSEVFSGKSSCIPANMAYAALSVFISVSGMSGALPN